jgi:hypothetical protein
MRQPIHYRLPRRRFAFWLGFSLFWVARKARADVMDELAASIMRWTEPEVSPWIEAETNATEAAQQERWLADENRDWYWFQRETWIEGRWKRTGITTPISKTTGEPYTGRQGYLDERLVPSEVRAAREPFEPFETDLTKVAPDGPDEGQPAAERRARDGRPPSQWLRSLNADELRIWLRTIEVPYVGVGGMTFWTHLTRDHSFEPDKIAGLTVTEQAKLHSAAHYGY